jgi:hypothetical protein
MAANIFVDPAIVATPDATIGRDGIVAWIENLTMWLNETLNPHFLWLHSYHISEELREHGLLPDFGTIRKLANRYGLDISSSALGRAVDTFFRSSEHDLEDCMAELGYMLMGDMVTIEPEEAVKRWPACICVSMNNLLVTCAACKQAGQAFAQSLYIATLRFDTGERELKVSAVVKVSAEELVCQPGERIEQAFPLLFVPEDLPWIDVKELWSKGEDGLIYAIAQQFKKDWTASGNQQLSFRLGGHFMESIETCGLHTNHSLLAKLIKCAAYVISGEARRNKMYELEQIRKSKSGNSSVRTRMSDGAEAWRLRIATGGGGWRLHYWHVPGPNGGSIEFSNICKHDLDAAPIYE